MRSWFLGLEARERQFVLGGAAALLFVILYLGVWEPVGSNFEQLKSSVKGQRSTTQWMMNSAAEVTALRQNGNSKKKTLGGRSLLAVVDKSARKAGLGSALKRVEPDGRDAVKVWLENASFDSIITWIGALSRNNGIEVRSVTIESETGNGLVNSRVTLVEPAAGN